VSGRRIPGALLALSLLLLSPSQADAAGAGALGALQARIGQAQQRLQELTGRRQSQQSVVERLRGRTQGFAVELGRVEEALFATIGRLRQAEADLARVEGELQQLEVEISEKEVAVEARSGVYSTRLRALYKYTRTSPLEQLLAAHDFSDVMRRVTMMQAVTRVDNLLLGQLRAEQLELLRVRESLRQKQAEAMALRDEVDLQRTTLDLRRAEQATLLEVARRDQGQAEATLTEYDQQARTEQASIATLQSQYQRELDEIERQRQEEQRRQQAAQAASASATAQARAQSTAQAAESSQAAQAARSAQAAQTATAGARVAQTSTAQTQATSRARAAAPPSTPTPQRAAAQPTATAPRPSPTATPAPPARQAPATGATAAATSGPRGASPTARSGWNPTNVWVNTTGLAPSAEGFNWPVSNPLVTTEYGDRSPFQVSHTGIDLATSLYAPVRAAADGIVIDSGLAVAGKPAQSYGMRVSVAHKGGLATLYAHLDDEKNKPTVKAGDRVERGQVIGYIGMTGLTTGPHLHFEVLTGGEPRNPRLYLPK
jgi:murein DD-endopeptidase MepM/ murein hydrolase activator NlpD